jgi:hypothetical protein
MPSQLVSSSGCCQPCDSDPVVVNIPGPQGDPGANGTNGTNGIDSFSYTTAQFFVPALGSSVVVPLSGTSFLPESVAGQFFVSIQGVGYMQVTDVTGLNVTLLNPASGVLGIPNAVPTTSIPSGSLVTLAGGVGPQGAAGVSGGAPLDRSYIIRTDPGVLTNATVLDSLTAGYMKTAGSGGAGVVSTVATVPVADISGTLPIAKGGTNLTTAPANKIPVGDGTTYLQKEIVGTAPIVVTNSAGNITLSAPSIVAFNYVTFTRRVVVSNLIVSGTTKNPFSLADFPSGSWTSLDPSSGFTAATGRFTVPYTGYYTVDVLLNLVGDSGTAQVTVFLRKNGITNIFQSLQFNVTNSATQQLTPVSISYIDQATAITDYYEVLVQSNSHSVNVTSGSSISVQRIQA